MICQLITWPARTAWKVADEGIWLVRAAAEIYGYGLTIGPPDHDDEDWLASEK